jgi:hypothetical protein
VVLHSLGLDPATPVGHATQGWLVRALSVTGSAAAALDPSFRTRALAAAVAYTAANAQQRALALAVAAGGGSGGAFGDASAAWGGGGGPASPGDGASGGWPAYGGSAAAGLGDRRPALKRQLKVVLRDLATVVAGEANAGDCLYDLSGL